MNAALYSQPSYTANYHAPTESIEQVVERKIKEGITAALGQLQLNSPRNNNSNINRNNNNNSSNRCYLYNELGHFARDCNQRSISKIRTISPPNFEGRNSQQDNWFTYITRSSSLKS